MGNFFQATFTKITKNDGTWRMGFLPNGPPLPDDLEIDEMIKILDGLRSRSVRKEWDDWFKEAEREIEEREATMKQLEEKQKTTGYIYLLESQNLYKIGRTKCPKSRIKTYKTENPFGAKVIFQKEVDNYVKIETSLLKKFQNKQVRGEWFKLNKEDVEWIKQNIKGLKT